MMKRIRSYALVLCTVFCGCMKYPEGEITKSSGSRIVDYTLGLGISVTLNTHSLLNYKTPLTGVMNFYGEGAFFIEKASSEGAKIVLDMNGIRVECEDGEFYIDAYGSYGWDLGKPAEVKLSVFNGKVVVRKGAGDTTIQDGSVRLFRDSISTAVKWLPKEQTYWVNGLYKYEQAPIYEFARMLRRWFGVDVGIEPQHLDSILHGVQVQKDLDLASQLQVLEAKNNYLFTFSNKDSLTITHK